MINWQELVIFVKMNFITPNRNLAI
ncbi:hypothetical protein BLA29_015001 [Euroglyphus maynei]|uniref:Uncharacterized protein n=1 Tax=Euroglyphus maynei TaxID=6958 RepID=A0A1Y3BVR0_EURMA|nr:hypothetical protein BLA29_015001 [Euroglyphus maynei]